MDEQEANETVRRMDTLLRYVACLFVGLFILALGGVDPFREIYRTFLLTTIVLAMCGMLIYFMKLCKRMERYDEENRTDR